VLIFRKSCDDCDSSHGCGAAKIIFRFAFKTLENNSKYLYNKESINKITMGNMKILIKGKKKLSGKVKVSGAKNAALPELAAVLLSSGDFDFSEVPRVEDIKVMFKALQNIGAEGEFNSNRIKIKIPEIKSSLVPKNIVETSRASILILGPLVARSGYAKVSLPGGCSIGDRKINFHLEGLRKMGSIINVEEEHIIAKTSGPLQGIDYTFPDKTVTGTENLLMAATLAEGASILRNCAVEPEISDLIELLLKMGADITGKNSETLKIKGKPTLNGAKHKIIPDRIEMGTYVIAGAFHGNDILIENTVPEYIASLLEILKKIGVNLTVNKDWIRVNSGDNFHPIDVETQPFPGFPTDLQAQLTTLLTQVDGVSRVRENIFNNRFKHTLELNKLGADIKIIEDVSIIKGKTNLTGREITATDLRASAALVLGGLIAEGETIVNNSYQLLRGYEDMPQKLQELGAEVKLFGA
jgi:UDP-N-acetylglucosamine 1-carboxyvinyltransferase